MKKKMKSNIPEDIQTIIDKPRLSKREATILSKWLTEQTGKENDNCFCSSALRLKKQEEVKQYINGNN